KQWHRNLQSATWLIMSSRSFRESELLRHINRKQASGVRELALFDSSAPCAMIDQDLDVLGFASVRTLQLTFNTHRIAYNLELPYTRLLDLDIYVPSLSHMSVMLDHLTNLTSLHLRGEAIYPSISQSHSPTIAIG